MRLSKALIDMEMADYSAALDPAYTTLEFENMQVLAMGNGKSPPSSPLRCGGTSPGAAGGEVPGAAAEMLPGRAGAWWGVSAVGSQQLTAGFLLPPGRNRGGGAVLCSAQAGWCPAAQRPRGRAHARSWVQ